MTHTNITIKKATLDNVDDIEYIENICFSTPWSKDSIIQSLSNPCSFFAVAIEDEKVVGYMGLQIFSGEGYVTNVAVLPEFRRIGIAQKLIDFQLQNNMEFITLEVRKSNIPAINLYSKLGFKTVGERPKFYREPTENAVLMTKYL